jgi:hypothetical protein
MSGSPLRQAGTPASAPAVLQFDRTLLLENSAENSANVSMGDLNGDGNLDIVLAKGRHTPLVDRVLINDGRGRFPVAQDLGGADRSYSAGLVDLDVDGDLDIVVSNDRPDPKPVYLNDGKGNFRLASMYGRPEWSMRNASVADLNGDRLPDIIAANRTGDNNGSNYVCLNRGKGQFDADCLAFSHESTTTITPADINRDGFIDLIVPHREGGQSYVYLNDGKAAFPKRIPFGPPDAAIRVAEGADLNGDGFLDIAAIDSPGPAVYFNEQGRAFAAGFSPGSSTAQPYALAVGDVNGDGKTDIVVGDVSARLAVYFNNGSGRNFTPVRFGDAAGTAYGFAIGDLDKDGYRDIAVARTAAPNVVYFGGPALRPEDLPAVPAARPTGPSLIGSFDVDSTMGLPTVQLAWFDRTGKEISIARAECTCRGVNLSPDGKRLAIHIHGRKSGDIYIGESNGTPMSRLTSDPGLEDNSSPIWSPDGTRVVFGSYRNGKWRLYTKSADGTGVEQQLLESAIHISPMSWSPDGLIVYRDRPPQAGVQLWVVPLTGGQDSVLFSRTGNENHAQISPDGKWIAYASDEAGSQQVYIRAFPSGVGKWKVSTASGDYPRWRGDGGELYFLSESGMLMASDIRVSGSSIEAGVPRALFDTKFTDLAHMPYYDYHAFAASPDGQRFLIPRLVVAASPR